MQQSSELAIGERVRLARLRRGMSRRQVAELAGRSEEWLRQIETGERPLNRLDTIQLLARVLQVRDLAEITGPLFSSSAGGRLRHQHLDQVRRALRPRVLANEPGRGLADLRRSVRHAETAWRVSRQQVSALGAVLPDLISDALSARRTDDPGQRREALRTLVAVYQLTDAYLRHAGERRLASQVCERMLIAAQDTDDPELMALATYRVAAAALGEGDAEEGLSTALDSLLLIKSRVRAEDQAFVPMWGAFNLLAATCSARLRRSADADRMLEIANQTATRLGPSYHHGETLFGQLNCAIQSAAIAVDTGRATGGGATSVDVSEIPSASRRTRYHIELAQAAIRRRDHEAALGLLCEAERHSTEIPVFNHRARSVARDLLRARRPSREAFRLADRLRVLA